MNLQKTYTVQELASLAGVSVRTLHHYDSIGLLAPSSRSEAGYRLYGESELYRLQQILFYREVDMPLKHIRSVLDDPSFDLVQALENHKKVLKEKSLRLQGLVRTIDKTLSRIKGEDEMVTDKELYCEFSKETLAEYQDYMAKKFDPEIMKEAEESVKKMSKKEWEETNLEGQQIAIEMTQFLKLSPNATEVQDLVERHHAWVEKFYSADAKTYTGLADLYLEHPDFKSYYEKFSEGLTEFLAQAMRVYSDEKLK